MSLTSLNYDSCTYQHNLKQSVGISDYMIGAPRNECNACFPIGPNQMGSGHAGGSGGQFGGSVCADNSLIDVSSELLNITRKASNCPAEKYIPFKPVCQTIPLRDCKPIVAEDTRISNPPCTLRSTGWNRWEWLCKNPQDKSLVPFDFNISNRIVVKDNHRPCIPNPISVVPALPPLNGSDTLYSEQDSSCSQSQSQSQQYAQFPSVHWRKQKSYGDYLEQ